MFGRIRDFIENNSRTVWLVVVIVTGVLGVLFSPLERTDVLNALSSTVAYLGASVPLSRWVFGLLVAAALVGIAFLGFPLVDRLKKLRKKKSLSYIEDVFNGVRWRWKWHRSGLLDQTPYCVECDHELSWHRPETYRSSVHLRCPKCNSVCLEENNPTGIAGKITMGRKTEREITQEIEQRARALDRGEKLPSG